MSYCQNCGKDVNDATFCPYCGVSVASPRQSSENAQDNSTYNNPGYSQVQQNYMGTPASGQLNTGMLVWSIINIVISTVFGIIALIYTVNAQNASSAEEEASKLKTAKILNIIGTALASVVVVIGIIVLALVIAGSIAAFSL